MEPGRVFFFDGSIFGESTCSDGKMVIAPGDDDEPDIAFTGDHEQYDLENEENVEPDAIAVQKDGPYRHAVRSFGADEQGKHFLDKGKKDRDLRPVGIADVFITIVQVIAGRDLAAIVWPVLVNVGEAGQLGIGPYEIKVEGRVEHHPMFAVVGFYDVVSAVMALGQHLTDAYGEIEGADNSGEDLGIAAAGSVGGHQVDGCGMEETVLGAEETAVGKGGGPVIHEVIAIMHSLYEERIGIVVDIQPGLDVRFDRRE